MISREREAAIRLQVQQRQRMKVVKRERAANTFVAACVAVGIMAVGYMVADTIKDFKDMPRMSKEEKVSALVEMGYMDTVNVTDEDKARASAKYDKRVAVYSPEAIANTKWHIIEDYQDLITEMHGNIVLNINSNSNPLDPNRLEMAEASYKSFVTTMKQDSSYRDAAETERAKKAAELYALDLRILQDTLKELVNRGMTLKPGSDAYLENANSIKTIGSRIGDINEALQVLSYMDVGVYMDHDEPAASR